MKNNIAKSLFWYTIFLGAVFVFEFLFMGSTIHEPSERLMITVGIVQVGLQLGAAHYCMHARRCCFRDYVWFGLAIALCLMALRRITAFMIMFGKISEESIVPYIDRLFLPLLISTILFFCFKSLTQKDS